eukprot:TRINITY_DN4997_c0_g4_i1.p1 TRINITY_DN4997_c0_g4~~TRINITY_DN4997_c0_g4_i1.p1  ORF type:complete len:609 (-),score=110.86 TRINITY_DN4997_c0_g4_i1:44-1750(-)
MTVIPSLSLSERELLLRRGLSNYTAMQTQRDHCLYDMLKAIDIPSNPFDCPWGPSLSTDAMSPQSSMFSGRNLNWIFNILDPSVLAEGPAEGFGVTKDARHDPRSLLPLFAFCVEHPALIEMRRFVQNGCLSYCVLCTSSENSRIRSWAYEILSRSCDTILEHKSSFEEQAEVGMLLRTYINTVKEENAQISGLLSSFFSQAILLMFNPQHPATILISRRFLLRTRTPMLFSGEAAMWDSMFHGAKPSRKHAFQTCEEIRKARCWVLNCVRLGIKSSHDYRTLAFHRAFIDMMYLFLSEYASRQERQTIISVFRHISSMDDSSCIIDLIVRQGFLEFLSSVLQMNESVSTLSILEIIRDIFGVHLSRSSEEHISACQSIARVMLSSAMLQLRKKIAYRDDFLEVWHQAIWAMSEFTYSCGKMETSLSAALMEVIHYDPVYSVKTRLSTMRIASRFDFTHTSDSGKFQEAIEKILLTWVSLTKHFRDVRQSKEQQQSEAELEEYHSFVQAGREWLNWLEIHLTHAAVIRDNMDLTRICHEAHSKARLPIPASIRQSLHETQNVAHLGSK